MAELLAISHVFVLASNAEGLPISIIEASCAGVPVVATDVGGISDLLALGVDIRLTRLEDADHLTTAMREALESYCPLAVTQRKARSCAVFSIENTAEQYRELYRELFEERNAA